MSTSSTNQEVTTCTYTESGTGRLEALCQRMQHTDILSTICRKCANTQLTTLMRTSRGLYEIAGRALYHTLTLTNAHEPLECSALYGLPKGLPPRWRDNRIYPDPDEVTSGRKDKLLAFTQVLRLQPGVCDRGLPRPEGDLSFPNLRTLHKTYIEPCESKSPDTIACHTFENGRSPKLHTLVLRNRELLGTWRQYCRPKWGGPPWNTVKRIVLIYSSPSRLTYELEDDSPREKRVREGEELDSFNIVFRPSQDSGTWEPESSFRRGAQRGDIASHCDTLVTTLAEICGCEPKRVVIAGIERLGQSMWLDEQKRGWIPPQEERVEEVHRMLRRATETALTGKAMEEKLGRIVFMTLEEYMTTENGRDELDGEDGVSSGMPPGRSERFSNGVESDSETLVSEDSGYDAVYESD